MYKTSFCGWLANKTLGGKESSKNVKININANKLGSSKNDF